MRHPATIRTVRTPAFVHEHNGLAPPGGAANQVLKKLSGLDYNYSWQADATGGTGTAPAVERADAVVTAAASVLDFSAAFLVTDSPAGEANVSPNFGALVDTVAQGNDARFSDQRTPTDLSVTNAKVADAAAIAESKLALASDAAANVASRRTLGTGTAQAAAGNHAHSGLAPVGGAAGQVLKKNTATDYDYSWAADATGGGGSQATETLAGIAEIATQAETDAGTDDTRFVTPLKLASLRPSAQIARTAVQSIPNTTWTQVALNTTAIGSAPFADPTNSRLVVQSSGTYLLVFNARWNDSSAGGDRALRVKKNGLVLGGEYFVAKNPATRSVHTHHMFVSLIAGDLLTMECYHDAGVALDLGFVGQAQWPSLSAIPSAGGGGGSSPPASETAAGIVELATLAEAGAATATNLAVTPAGLAQYQLDSEKGAANGYASLGLGGRVPVAQLASGTPDGTRFVRDDGTLAVPTGSGNTPVGGSAGQVLKKVSATDYDYSWQADATGGGSAAASPTNLTELRALAVPPAATVVELLGSTAANDGGGGTFFYSSASTAADDGAMTITPTANPATGRWLRLTDPGWVNVMWFGAKGDGVTNDVPAFQAAVDHVYARGGGTVWAPDARYLFSSGSLTIKSNVTLLGGAGSLPELDVDAVGSQSLATMKTAMILCTSTANTPITLVGSSPTVRGFTFYHPNQVLPTATAPVVYPPVVRTESGESMVNGPTVQECFFVNCYDGIFYEGFHNRGLIDRVNMGSLHFGILIDGSVDVDRITEVHMWPWYVRATGNGSTTLDTNWVYLYSKGLIVRKADWLVLSNFFAYGKNICISLEDSPYTTGIWATAGRNSIGIGTNVQLDYCAYGIAASSTQVGGWTFQGLQIYVAHGAAVGILTSTGGTGAPVLRVQGGIMNGPSTHYALHQSGKLAVDCMEYLASAAAGGFYYKVGAGYLRVGGCRSDQASGSCLVIEAGAGGRVMWHNNDFWTMAYSAPAPAGGFKVRDNFGIADGG